MIYFLVYQHMFVFFKSIYHIHSFQIEIWGYPNHSNICIFRVSGHVFKSQLYFDAIIYDLIEINEYFMKSYRE